MSPNFVASLREPLGPQSQIQAKSHIDRELNREPLGRRPYNSKMAQMYGKEKDMERDSVGKPNETLYLAPTC